MDYNDKLAEAVRQADSTLCVGLDPNIDLLPAAIRNGQASPPVKVRTFLKKVIDVTQEHCAAYKPNLGFFEALGPDGWDVFQEILAYLPPGKMVIADAKRGDISSTAEHYAKAFFEQLEVDAITLNPLMGFETLDPFLDNASNGVYTLTLTSNPGAADILLKTLSSGETVATYIARELQHKQESSAAAIGMVVGATKAPDLQPVISQFPASPLLIPGVGKQGGSVSALAEALKNHHGIPLINSSRSILYAGGDSDDWEQEVRQSAKNLKERISPITATYV
ncbi:orotidine-5'-phosphate decarboxylase [Fodinibius sediminis]|uniref:Orotidine-5'-phosphate decarboxylase n=1 Tax=Fodinibius sediminis TaxID=1214077 RepID=A0A521D4Q6_9BACT|nr:orotidine-5'-phosphate decarboxylase [Fodinibius sediminis]SMO66071.1 orotidine-5'-phosphate decarboxylase [Fodinibius sediminis]